MEIGTIDNFNINSSGQKEKDRVLSIVANDLIAFGQLFLPDDFMKSSPAPFHYEVGKKLLDPKSRKMCIVLPRGHSKSTMAKAALLHKIYFNPQGKKEFAAWVSEEQGQAVDHLKYIKNHMEYNNALNYYFGDMVGDKWTEKEITTSRGDRIIAKGTSQRLRGRSELGTRYTKIILDDFESELNTKTPDRRREIKEWLMSTVYPSLEESKGNEGSIWLIGTIVHYDSALQAIYDGYLEAKDKKEEYTWDVIFHRVLEDGKPLWESYFNKNKINQIRRDYENVGQLHKFAQEYMNDARDVTNAAFKIDRIQYYSGHFEKRGNMPFVIEGEDAIPINVYIGVDLAATASETSDYQVILVMGIDANKNRYILDYFRERIPAFDVPPKIIEYAKKYNPVRRVTIETVAAQEMVRDMVTRLSATEKRLMPGLFKGVKPPARIKKEDRLETALGQIVNSKKLHIYRHMTEIVDEFFEHPKPRNDDLLDGLYYADYFAKAPKSDKMKVGEIDATQENLDMYRMKKTYNWMTGAKA